MTLTEIIEKSGDSSLKKVGYQPGELTIGFELGEEPYFIELSIETYRVSFFPGLEISNKHSPTFYIDFRDLDDCLFDYGPLYIPNQNKSLLMEQINNGYYLAYGLKQKDYQYFFSLKGASRLVNCIVRNIDAIKIVSIVEID
jgi:hypothetical protein